MPRCTVCDGEEFDLQDGLYYCVECSTQSQDIREVEVEEDYGEGMNLRTVKLAKKPQTKEAKPEGPRWHTAEAFNIIIRHQADALVKLGASPEIKEVILNIWGRYLQEMEQGFTSTNQNWKPKLSSRPYVRDVQVLTNRPIIKQTFRHENGFVRLASSRKKSLWKKKKDAMKNVEEEEESNEGHEEVENDGEGGDSEIGDDSENGGSKKRKKKMEEERDGKKTKKRKRKRKKLMEEEGDGKKAKKKRKRKKIGEDQEMKDEELKKKKKLRNPFLQYKWFSQNALKTFDKLGSKSKAITRKSWVSNRISMLSIISICCLALRWTKETILMTDIIRWIREGHIPFINAHRLLPQDWTLYRTDIQLFGLPDTYGKISHFADVPSFQGLYKGMLAISRIISKSMFKGFKPVLGLHYVALRFLMDLNLPYELMTYINIIHTRFLLARNSQGRVPIEVYAVASIMLVLKHLFGLDGRTERKLSELAKKDNLELPQTGEEPFFVWSEWQQHIELVADHPKNSLSSPDACNNIGPTPVKNDEPDHHLLKTALPSEIRKYEMMQSIQRNLSQLTSHKRHDAAQKKPPTSFHIRRLLKESYERNGRPLPDFCRRRLHSARSELYWTYPLTTNEGKKDLTEVPTPFALVLRLLQDEMGIPSTWVLYHMYCLEQHIFGTVALGTLLLSR